MTGVFIIKADFPWKEWEQSDLSRLKACVSSTRYVAQSILAIMEFKYFTNKLNSQMIKKNLAEHMNNKKNKA